MLALVAIPHVTLALHRLQTVPDVQAQQVWKTIHVSTTALVERFQSVMSVKPVPHLALLAKIPRPSALRV